MEPGNNYAPTTHDQMITAEVTIVIPVIPPRVDNGMFERAVTSAKNQTMPVEILYGIDHGRYGAAVVRSELTKQVVTPWVAFLDDDDELLPFHCEALLQHANETEADYVFSDWIVPEAPSFRLDSFCYGDWDPLNPMQTTITTLVRMEVAQEFGFVMPNPDQTVGRDLMGEDFEFTRRINDAGYKISHLKRVTWWWHHHGANTSGMPHRWK